MMNRLSFKSFSIYASTSVRFIWNNIPSIKELVIFSGIQSVFEIILNTDKMFGNNPMEKSIVRDLGKIFGEIPLVLKNVHYGTTKYWHDTLSLTSSILKPFIKSFVIKTYERNYHIDTEIHFNAWEKLISQNNHTNISNKFPESIQKLLETYTFKQTFGKASRISNAFGEPMARVIDGASKKRQDELVTTFEYNVLTKEEPFLISDCRFTEYKSQSNLNLKEVPSEIAKNTLGKAPYAMTYSLLKTAVLDYIGKLYGMLGTKQLFGFARETFDENAFSFFFNEIFAENFKGLSFYERTTIILEQENLTYITKWSAISATFISELTEKTFHNMLTMTIFSTPNKLLGNLLHMSDKASSYIFRTVGIAAGAWYFKKEFFENTAQGTTFNKFLQKQSIDLSIEEQCYVNFIDEIFDINNGSLPESYENTEVYEESITKLQTFIIKYVEMSGEVP